MGSLLDMRDVRKRFGAVIALGGVDLEVRAGEVHALIGENGAGKSTLMKVLSGALAPDSGEMTFADEGYRPRGPRDAARRGVSMIYQELNLAPDLTVAQNIVLGREPRRRGFVDAAAMRATAQRALERLGPTVGVSSMDRSRWSLWAAKSDRMLGHGALALDARVADLGPGSRQLVEIARALAAAARLVVMDEPTSSLSGADAERLFAAIARLRDDGVAVIYISHFLEEVARIADRFTVLRDGRTVATGAMRDASLRTLIQHMVGRPLDEIYPRTPHGPAVGVSSMGRSRWSLGTAKSDRLLAACRTWNRAATNGSGPNKRRRPQALELSEVSGVRLPHAVNLSLQRGEILGIAGLVGAGRSELLRAIFGLDPLSAGRVFVAGRLERRAAPWARLAQGIGLLSEDRAGEGLALSMSVTDNLTLSHLGRGARLGFLRPRARGARVRHWLDALAIRAPDPALPVGRLSGGNQQKVALARLLDLDVDVLLLDEPTRGVDVGSKAEIYRLMGALAASGKALIFVSSYIPELLGVCDRLAVMHRGRLQAPRPVAEWSATSVLAAATGGGA